MKLSVIIPALNEEKYLPATLESIKKQDRQPDELIVVDGGSTDQTAEVARKFGASVLTVPTKGIGYARQRGLEIALGEIVVFTDADTVHPHNWLTRIEETFHRPGVVGVIGWYRVYNGWWPYRFAINIIQPPIFNLLHIMGIPLAAGQNIAFLREVGLAVGGFPENYVYAEDTEMKRRLATRGKVILRNDIVVASSGRRGNEGLGMFFRVLWLTILYYLFHRGDQIGFPTIR